MSVLAQWFRVLAAHLIYQGLWPTLEITIHLV